MRKLSKKEWIAAAVALAFIGYMFFGDTAAGVISMFNGGDANTNMDNSSQTAASDNAFSVQVQDVKIGTGTEIQKGMEVGVNYVLRLADGTLIQDSKQVNNGEAFKFIVGGGQLIPGWEMGILGMKVGGKRLIIIPPDLGYGSEQAGPIPPNSTLIFEIEIVSAK